MSSKFTIEEVSRHNVKNDCWIIVGDDVLDCTKWLSDHPGGGKTILQYAGKDATKQFNLLHEPGTIESAAPWVKIGKLVKGGSSSAPESSSPSSQQSFQTREQMMGRYSNSSEVPSPIKVDFSQPNNPISLLPIQPTHASETPSRNSGGTAAILPAARKLASFDVNEMISLIDGGPKKTKNRRFIESPTADFDFFDKIYWSTPEILREHVRLYLKIHESYWNTYRPTREEVAWMTRVTINKGSMMNHYGLFLPTLLTRASPRQVMEFLIRTLQMKIIGVYAQTELGHGSNVRGLQTTAHYDKKTEEFILNTPTLSSMKWWPGTLGKVGTHAVVYAQLILEGKEYGIHEFILQIRDSNHRPFPGIELGDLGPKLGDNANDTGFMRLENVRIPRDRMLSRYQQVSPDGKYMKSAGKANPRTHYMTMMIARGSMMRGAGDQLARAATVATRYSEVRKQGFTDSTQGISYKSKEKTILDHQIQAFRIFRQISRSYAFIFAGIWMSSKFGEWDKGDSNLASMKELASTSNGLKAMCTVMALEGIEDCRKCCGGNGYLMASGVATQAADYAWQCTAEGDFVILFLQTARYLIQRVRDIKKGDKVVGHFAYLNAIGEPGFSSQTAKIVEAKSADDFLDLDFLAELYRIRALSSLGAVSDDFEGLIAKGQTWDIAFNSCAVQLLEATKYHCMSFLVELFRGTVSEVKGGPCKEVLQKVGAFFAVSHLLDSNWAGVLDFQGMRFAQSASSILLTQLRNDAVPLVDAFDFPDRVLSSAIGRYDGNIYEALFESAKKSELNQMDPFLGYEDVLRPYLDLEFLKAGNAKRYPEPKTSKFGPSKL
uniref:Peroxisomal acyl-coenzyme A oxidase 1 isoform X1 n=1 Tax=Hirondellea gigas TaxID=1518452 RepID=A0A6A7GC50_9CRUS